jgi:hypothetical protein
MELLNKVKTALEAKGYDFENMNDETLTLLYDAVYTAALIIKDENYVIKKRLN